MADNNERVLISEDAAEEITGGQLLYHNVRGEQCYLYPEANPNEKWTFDYANFKDMNYFMFKNCKGFSDEMKIKALYEAGYIQKM